MLNKLYTILFISIVQISTGGYLYAQPALPSHQISVTATQSLNFGSFCLASINGIGGSVTVDWQGIRTATGDVLLMPLLPMSQPAIFQIQLCQGRNIILEYSPVNILTGSNGGSLTLNLGPSEYGPSGSSFPVSGDCNFITTLRMGGTLVVGDYSQNPEGSYSGTFEIICNYE